MKKFLLAIILLTFALPGCTGSSERSRTEYRQTGIASYYGHESSNRTANGERFRPGGLTGAIWGLPFNTKVRVTNLKNKKLVIVRINDRGPSKRLHRIIDLSQGSAEKIGMLKSGVARVLVEEVH